MVFIVKVNFADGVREKLVQINLLAEWDYCTEQSREAHDKQIREKYNRSNEQERLDKIFNR